MKTFEDLLKLNPNKGVKIPIENIIKNGKYIIPGWVKEQKEDIIIKFSTDIEKETGFSSQDLYDILVLGLVNKSHRPKCLVCEKNTEFRGFNRGYLDCCSIEHTRRVKSIDKEKLYEAKKLFPSFPALHGYYLSIIKNKFNDNIYPIDIIYSLTSTVKFFCKKKDPLTGVAHGEFEARVDTLIKRSTKGCMKCYRELHVVDKNNIPWKSSFFEKLEELYPNQIKFLHSNNISFPTIHSKLHFKCLLCGHEFDKDPDSLLFGKVAQNKSKKLIACPKCCVKDCWETLRIWTKESCFEEAKKYNYRSDFSNKAPGAYKVACLNGYLDDYTWFSTPKLPNISDINRTYSIYEYNFSSLGYNVSYIGLTSNISNRKLNHSSKYGKSSVFKFCEKNNINLKEKTNDIFSILEINLNGKDAQIKEDFWRKTRETEGYNLLNKAKTGLNSSSLGGGAIKWSIEDAEKELIRAKETDSRINSRKDLNRYYNRPFKIVLDADKANVNNDSNRLNRIFLPKCVQYTVETYEKSCNELLNEGVLSYSKKTKEQEKIFNKLKAAAYLNKTKKFSELQIKFQKIFNKIFQYYCNSDEIILHFSDSSRKLLKSIYLNLNDASKYLGKDVKIISTYLYRKSKNKEFIRLRTWLETDYTSFLEKDKDFAEKLYSEIMERIEKLKEEKENQKCD